MSPVTPQEEGRLYEEEFAAQWGADPVPGSGSTPRAKLDVGDVELIFSLKWTSHESYRLTAADIQEMRAGASGPGSKGKIGAMAIRIQGAGADVVVVETETLLALARGEIKIEAPASKRQAKLAAAEPSFLRGESAT